jgi:hypothetical protein
MVANQEQQTAFVILDEVIKVVNRRGTSAVSDIQYKAQC